MKKQGSLKNSFYRPDWGRIVKALSFVLLFAALICVTTKESQAQSAAPGAARAQCSDLLQRARQAINEGKLADAETLIGQAESLNVQFEPLYTGDTPARLRRELDRAKGASASTQSQDPFAIRGQNSAPSVPAVSPVTNASALAKKYILEGRSSLNLGAFDKAEQLCSEAMKLKVAYAPGEDTPERLMRDIQTA